MCMIIVMWVKCAAHRFSWKRKHFSNSATFAQLLCFFDIFLMWTISVTGSSMMIMILSDDCDDKWLTVSKTRMNAGMWVPFNCAVKHPFVITIITIILIIAIVITITITITISMIKNKCRIVCSIQLQSSRGRCTSPASKWPLIDLGGDDDLCGCGWDRAGLKYDDENDVGESLWYLEKPPRQNQFVSS